MALEEGGKIPLALVFTHPFEAGHTMDMGMPEQFFVIRSRGENAPQKTDLLKTLKPMTWTSLTNSGKAWETEYAVRGGDYTFCLVPEPYYEPEEEGYIKQSTKDRECGRRARRLDGAGRHGHGNRAAGQTL